MHKLSFCLLAVALSAQASEPTAPAGTEPTDAGTSVMIEAPAPAPFSVAVPAPVAHALPPMNFTASVAAGPLYEQIKAVPAFARAEQDLAGSPIRLLVTHTLQPTAGGQATGFLSAIVSGSTLGLVPLVTNNNLVLSYEVTVNGRRLLRRDFERAFTRAQNIWNASNDPTYGLGEEGLAWAIETAGQFARDAVNDPALAELAREYAFYFEAAD